MKNRLEDEYRQLMQNETPDLWERISAGIDAKIAAGTEVDADACVEVTKNTPAEMTENSTGIVTDFETQASAKNKIRSANVWKKYSLPLAACIAAVLCVPLMLTGILRMASGGSKSTESAAADMAVAEEFYSTTTEAEDASSEEYFYEAAVEEEAAAEEAPAEAPESVMDEETTEGAIGNLTQDTAETLGEEIEETETEINESQTASGAEQEILDLEKEKEEQQVLTVITLSAEEGLLGEERAKGSIYYLTTEEEGECTVFVPSELAFVIELGQQIKIAVEQGNDEYDYVFVKMAE